MTKKVRIPRWARITLRAVLWTILGIVLLLGILLALLQTHSVQNYVTARGLEWASDQTDHTLFIDNIRIAWFDEISISGFELKDYADTTLTRADRIYLNYDLWEFLNTRKLELDAVELERGMVQIYNHADSVEDINLNVFLNSLENITGSEEEEDTTSTTESQPISLGYFRMTDFKLSLHDQNQDRIKDKADFNHIDFQTNTLEIENLQLKSDSISLVLKSFTGADKANGLELTQFTTRVGYTETNIILDDLRIETPHSSFGDSLALAYDSPSALSSFTDSVSFFLSITDAKLGHEDIRQITGVDQLQDDLLFAMNISGQVGDVRLRNAEVAIGRSKLNMDASLKGLPVLENTFMDFNLDKSRIQTSDIKHYLGENSESFSGIDWLDLNLSLSGFMNDFSTKGSIYTNYGGMSADMNITIPEDVEMAAYTGHLYLHELDVGKLIGDTALVQRVSLKGRLLGKGITPDKASFLTEINGHDIGVMNYQYDSIRFKGYLAAERFYGQFGIVDPNCQVSGRTDVDIRSAPEKLSLTASIDTLRASELNLTDDNIALSTRINWKQQHLNPDSLTGHLLISDTHFSMDSIKTLSLKNVDLITNLDSTQRSIDVRMPGIEMDIDGQFTFSNVARFIQQEMVELTGYFDLQDSILEEPIEPLDAQLIGKLYDLDPYLDFFSPGLVVSDSTVFNMFLEKKEDSDGVFSIYSFIDSLVYNEDVFIDNELDVYASMAPESDEILGSFLMASREQRWKAVPNSENFELEGIWLNDKIALSTRVNQPDTDTHAYLEAEVQLYSDSIEFRFKPSELTALGRTWNFDPTNYVNFSRQGILFRSLDLISENRRASLNGLLSESESSTVRFIADNIHLEQLKSVLNIPVEGIFGADFQVFRMPDKPIQFEGSFDLDDFIYKDIKIGDIAGRSFYDVGKDGIHASLSVARENFKTITVDGYYYPDATEQLDLLLEFDDADFKLLEVVTEGNLSDISGRADGRMEIKGQASLPQITGYCQLKDAEFLVDYLQARYSMGGRIELKKDEIGLSDFILRDTKGDVATLKGSIYHKNFDEIVTDLHINAKEFTFLNTSSRDNDLYYGTANATGDIFVTGPFSDLILKVNAKTEKGTKFFIPLTDAQSYEQAEFMTFVNFSDTTAANSLEREVSESGLGLTIDFDLEVTTDAYCELIFNIKTGDIIRGKGNGNLKLKLDKNGNFELFGALNIQEGGYNFTVPNFINKEFQVVPGSTINWYGDPYSGSMDLIATYRQKAAFSGLTGDTEDGELQQKLPLDVMLQLSGQMLAPTIGFDLALDESVSPSQNITRLLNQVKSDEQQLKRQVVSLMFLKRFSPLQDSFVGGGGGGVSIGKSLSEFLTNQISYLASQIDENLEVEVDLTNLDQDGFNTFQLRLAYTFLDGRLKVSRGGDFVSATNEQTSVNDIIGDWAVEYMLTQDGKLRAKMFSRSNQTQVSTDGQQTMETGLSLKYVTSFNRFSDLMRRTRSDAIQRKEDDEGDAGDE